METRIFHYSLIVSCLIHIVLLGSMFLSNLRSVEELKKKIEVVYYTALEKKEEKPARGPDVQRIKERPSAHVPDILTKKTTSPLAGLRDFADKPVNMDVYQKAPSTVPALQGKRSVSVPVLHSDKITNPKYINYNDQIRNKIENRAYFYADSPDFQSGEVYLTFVLLANGQLRETKIIESKTRANDYLKTIGLRSIKESSPFPPFPKDLNYPELTFNVIISFEVKE